MTAVLLMTALLSALLVGRSQWRELRSLPSPSVSAPAAAEVSIIIPARDEAENLPCLLTSVRSLASPVLEVIVVDDDSRDGTYEVALAGGAKAVTTRVPPGWTGKAWACQVGAGIADGRFLLFLDADTVLALLDKLTQDNYALAVDIAALPEKVRGFGHVKDNAVTRYHAELAELRKKFAAVSAHLPHAA